MTSKCGKNISIASCATFLLLLVMVMNLYSAFSIDIFKCALQASDLWVRSDISIYRRRWQPLSAIAVSDLTQHINEWNEAYMPYSLQQVYGFFYVPQGYVNSKGLWVESSLYSRYNILICWRGINSKIKSLLQRCSESLRSNLVDGRSCLRQLHSVVDRNFTSFHSAGNLTMSYLEVQCETAVSSVKSVKQLFKKAERDGKDPWHAL